MIYRKSDNISGSIEKNNFSVDRACDEYIAIISSWYRLQSGTNVAKGCEADAMPQIKGIELQINISTFNESFYRQQADMPALHIHASLCQEHTTLNAWISYHTAFIHTK